MSREPMWERVRMAWAMLSGRTDRDVQPGRAREPKPEPDPGTAALEAEGFAEEALPWLDAVYRFSMRLTRGEEDAAEDLVQETFLRAIGSGTPTSGAPTPSRGSSRSVGTPTSTGRSGCGTSASSPPRTWTRVEALSAAFEKTSSDPEREFFDRQIDDRVIHAIDALPEAFHEVLVLSDVGDLKYAEIAQVLDVPVGTVKSRLFRARKLLQDRLREFAVESGYVQEKK